MYLSIEYFAASGGGFLWVGRREMLDVLILSSALNVFAVRDRFSAPPEPMRTREAEAPCHPSARSFIFLSISSAALPLHTRLVFLFHYPSLPPLPSFAFLPFAPSALRPLSSPLCFRLALSSRHYTVAEGESVSDCNLSCPIISCCSVAELKDGLLIFFLGETFNGDKRASILSLI